MGRGYLTDVSQGNFDLRSIERVLVLALYVFALIVFIEQLLYKLSVFNSLFKNVLYVGYLYVVVGYLIGENGDERTVLTETVAACTLYLALDLYAFSARRKPFEFLCDLCAAVCKTAGAAAYADGLHRLSLLSVGVKHLRELLHSHLAVISIVDDHYRRERTGSQAVYQLEAEEPVLGGLAVCYAKRAGDAFHQSH